MKYFIFYSISKDLKLEIFLLPPHVSHLCIYSASVKGDTVLAMIRQLPSLRTLQLGINGELTLATFATINEIMLKRNVKLHVIAEG